MISANASSHLSFSISSTMASSTMAGEPFTGFGLHPHSGIATLTYMSQGNVSYEDTNGATGLLPEGGVGSIVPAMAFGTAAAPASPAAHGDFSSGSRCRPTWNSARRSARPRLPRTSPR